MFGLSGEHLLILAGILLIFGPRKLPELGSSVGKALRNFKDSFHHPESSGKVSTDETELLTKKSEAQNKDQNSKTTSSS